MSRPRLAFGCLLLSALATRTTAADDPAGLLNDVARAYKALPAYADQGVFTLSIVLDGKTHTTTQPAAIRLARPNRLRIEAGLASLACDGKLLTTLVGPSRKYASEPAPKTVGLHHVTEGPVGSLLIGGPGGPPLLMVLGLLLAEDPARGVLDIGGDLSAEPDADWDGKPSRVLRIASSAGTVYRLFVDPSTKLLRGIDVSPAPGAIGSLIPLGDRVQVSAYRWSAGPVSTEPPADEAFALELPRDFGKVGEVVAPEAGAPPEADAPAAKEPEFEVQGLIGSPTPEFKLTVLEPEGKTATVSNADLKGKVVMIDFWATWCGPCLAELPEVQTLIESYAKAGKEVVIVALSQDNDPRDPVEVRKLVDQTLEKQKLRLTAAPVGKVAIDPANEIGTAFRVEGYPTVVILDQKGVVRAAHVGFTPNVGKTLGKEIDALLEGKPVPDSSK